MNKTNKFLQSIIIAKRARHLKEKEEDCAIETDGQHPVLMAIEQLKNHRLRAKLHKASVYAASEDEESFENLYEDLKVKEDIDEQEFRPDDDMEIVEEPSEDELDAIEQEDDIPEVTDEIDHDDAEEEI